MKCFANTLFAEALLLSSMAREEQSVGYRAAILFQPDNSVKAVRGQRSRSVSKAPRVANSEPRY